MIDRNKENQNGVEEHEDEKSFQVETEEEENGIGSHGYSYFSSFLDSVYYYAGYQSEDAGDTELDSTSFKKSEKEDEQEDKDKFLDGEIKPQEPKYMYERAYAFSEAFLGVEAPPQLPRVQRAREDTTLFFEEKQPIVLQALDPYSTNPAVLPIRITVMLCMLVGALVLTFPSELSSTAGHTTIIAVGLAGFSSPALVRLALFFLERFVYYTAYRNKKKGQYPMVDWMSFTFFADALYNTVLGQVQGGGDIRDSKEIRQAARVYDERQRAQLDAQGRYVFDFVADMGDGFNPTFTVASLLGKGELCVTESHEGKKQDVLLSRARCVFAGGDLAYPFSSYENIFYRFVQPYSWAFPKSHSKGERIYLAAGNHEYMDGLLGFKKYLLTRSHIGGWELPQSGSYYAVRLPFNWVAFVLDIGPEPEDLDEFQQAYFDRVVKSLDAKENIILIYHVPEWIKCGAMGYTNMKRLREWRKSLGKRVRLVLTGDLHYYKRMELVEDDEPVQVETSAKDNRSNCFETERTQFYVCGHGGAFGHVTHFPRIDRAPLVGEEGKHVEVKCDYPSLEQSSSMVIKRSPFMFYTTTNHKYARFLGAIYMVFFIAVTPSIYMNDNSRFYDVIHSLYSSLFFYAALIFLLIVHIIMTCANFELNNFSLIFRASNLVIWHTVAHVAWAIVLRVAVDTALLDVVFKDHGSFEQLDEVWGYCTLSNLSVYLLGVYTGPLLMLIYYFIAYNFAGWHYNEIPGIIQSSDYKGFLRVAINRNGDLELYSIVADKSPSKWKEVPMGKRTNKDPAILASEKLDYYLLEKVTLKHTPSE